MKRYCQTLELYNDSELIRAYVAEHQHVYQKLKPVSVKSGYSICRFISTNIHSL